MRKKVKEIEIATGTDGRQYEIDRKNKTCKLLKGMDITEQDILNTADMNMDVYREYFRAHYVDEECVIKKNKMVFRDYRIYCSATDGFVIQDIRNRYKSIEHGIEGIPSPKELAEWFDRKKNILNDPSKKRVVTPENEEEVIEVNWDEVADEYISKVSTLKWNSKIDWKAFNAETFPKKKGWVKAFNKVFRKLDKGDIKFAEFKESVIELAKTFNFDMDMMPEVKVEKFEAPLPPTFDKVGCLSGNKIEVDGKQIDAVPFLVKYLLSEEPKAMPQLMKWAKGELTVHKLLKNPVEKDDKVKFDLSLIENTAENALVVTALYAAVGVVAPQDLMQVADLPVELNVGDKILIYFEDSWREKVITETLGGVCYGNNVGLLKLDKWIKL